MVHHVYSSIYYHLVWGTKNCEAFIKSEFKEKLYKYIGRAISENGWHLLSVGGTADHIHILIQITPKDNISDIVCKIKSSSSKFVRKNFCNCFAWQGGYSVFTVDTTSLPRLKSYIAKQEEHHAQKMSFEKELFKMLL
jgi:putative transposase